MIRLRRNGAALWLCGLASLALAAECRSDRAARAAASEPPARAAAAPSAQAAAAAEPSAQAAAAAEPSAQAAAAAEPSVQAAAAVAPSAQGAPAPPSAATPAPAGRALTTPSSAGVPEVFRVRFETSQGSFVVAARRDWAPLGVERLLALVTSGYFDDSRFFRVVPGYIAQFGIAGAPAVAAAWVGRTFADDPVRESNRRGTLAFAMTGPDTRSTQIYVNLVDNVRLDGMGFAPIGRVVDGMEVVDRLYGGYGEGAGGGMRAGHQGKMLAGGNAHLDAEFPKLDHLVRARVIS